MAPDGIYFHKQKGEARPPPLCRFGSAGRTRTYPSVNSSCPHRCHLPLSGSEYTERDVVHDS